MQLIHFPNILWLIFLLFSTISSDRNSVQQQHEDQKAEIVSLAAKHRLKREMPLNLPRDILTNRRKYRPRNQNTQLHSSVPVNKICTIKHNVIILFDARVNRQAFKEQIDLMKDFVYRFLKLSQKYPMYTISALQYDACSYHCYLAKSRPSYRVLNKLSSMRKSRQLFSVRRPRLYKNRKQSNMYGTKSIFEPIVSSLASTHKASILILFSGEPLKPVDIQYLRMVVNSLQTFTFGVATSVGEMGSRKGSNKLKSERTTTVEKNAMRLSLVNATGDARNVFFQGDYDASLPMKTASHRLTTELLTSKIAEKLNTNCKSSRELCTSTTSNMRFQTLCTKVECEKNTNTDLSCYVNLSGVQQCSQGIDQNFGKNKYSVPRYKTDKVDPTIPGINTTENSENLAEIESKKPCETGFASRNGTCTDINECEINKICSNSEICKNTVGSHICENIMCLTDKTCTNCFKGLCDCEPGYRFEPLLTGCLDIDECSSNPCKYGCDNTVGSYVCKCPNGYILDDSNFCVDFDECGDFASNECEFNDLCKNRKTVVSASDSGQVLNSPDKGYDCFCPSGLMLNSADSKTCLDIDECNDMNQCRESYDCFNTYGSYYCSCPFGFEDLGDFCREFTTTASFLTVKADTITPKSYYPDFDPFEPYEPYQPFQPVQVPTRKPPSSTNPPGCLCQNGSKCQPRGVNDFQCICVYPWEGRFCNENHSFGPFFHRKRKRRGRRQRRRKGFQDSSLKQFSSKRLERHKRKPHNQKRQYHHERKQSNSGGVLEYRDRSLYSTFRKTQVKNKSENSRNINQSRNKHAWRNPGKSNPNSSSKTSFGITATSNNFKTKQKTSFVRKSAKFKRRP